MKSIFKSKKQKNIFKLIFWLSFILIVYIVLVNENKKLDKFEEEYNAKYNFVIKYDYVKNSLLNNNYKYLYIVVDNGILSFEGQRINNLYSGTIKNGIDKEEYNNIKSLNSNYKYLDIKEVLSLFNGEFIEKNNYYIYEKNNLYVKIRVSIDEKVNIEINDNKVIYQLEIYDIEGFDIKGSE